MRVAFDALGAPASSGGMRLYAEEVLRAWVEAHPDDEVLVFGYPWVSALDLPGVRVLEQPEGGVGRVLSMWLRSGLRARRARVDALVSVSQVVSPLFPRARRICTVHDWRHKLHPEEFGRGQRVYRRSWDWSIARAGHATQISGKTLTETARFVPRAHAVLVPNGGDHPRRWPAHDDVRVPPTPYAVTFGHFVNKRPELVIEALAHVGTDPELRLVVTGARGAYADELAARAAALGVADRVELPGFVPEADYQALVAGAAVLVLASTDEGFGLPVSEAAWFGVPCVVTRDSGLPEIHGGRVRVADPDPVDLSRVLGEALALGPVGADRPVPTWRETAERLRALCVATG